MEPWNQVWMGWCSVTESDVDGDEPLVVVGLEYVMLEVVDDML